MMTFLKLAIAPAIGILLMALPIVWFVGALTEPAILETKAPGSVIFNISEGGKYVLWRELVGVSGDDEFRVQEKELPPGLAISIREKDSGTTVPIETSMGQTETVNGRSRAALITATLQPGNYELVSSTTNGEQMDLMLRGSRGSFGGVITGLFMGIAGFLLFFGGFIYILVFFIRRSVKKPTQPQL